MEKEITIKTKTPKISNPMIIFGRQLLIILIITNSIIRAATIAITSVVILIFYVLQRFSLTIREYLGQDCILFDYIYIVKHHFASLFKGTSLLVIPSL